MDCLFCNIITKKQPANLCYEDDKVIAFDDIAPIAPYHKLIVPREHIATLNDLTLDNNAIIGHLYYVAKQLASELGIADPGYRTIMNCNQDGGQTVFHIHLHLIGGKQMSWPPY